MSRPVVLTLQGLIAPIFNSCYSSTTAGNDVKAQQAVSRQSLATLLKVLLESQF